MVSRKATPWLCLSLLAVAGLATVGCGQAQAEPLDVTYYYLPG